MNSMLRFAPLLLLISCASVHSNTTEHNGRQVHQLTCSEFNTSLEQCKAKASELCAHDYKLISHHKEEYPDAGDGFYMHPRHHLSVECSTQG
ncbi:MAG TPA: hypothetical protein VGD04_00675 [Methylophilus sp.]